MTAPHAIHELVAKFDQHRKEYQTHKNETELRREFLDPFFDALGWDVFNKKSYSERFKQVQHETSVEVQGTAKAADYAFLEEIECWRDLLAWQIVATGAAIDRLVYELYGLTEEEVKIVEGRE